MKNNAPELLAGLYLHQTVTDATSDDPPTSLCRKPDGWRIAMARPQITTATQSVSIEVEGKTYPGSFTVSGLSLIHI